ncbi:MAG: hypothetical protein ACYTEL_24890 [Planctomycetota bacterium]|jgi:hypothetical protein
MTEEKPDFGDLAAQLKNIVEELESAREKESGGTKEGNGAVVVECGLKEEWAKFFRLIDEAKGTAHQLLALRRDPLLEEVLECLGELGSTRHASRGTESERKQQAPPFGGCVETYTRKVSRLLSGLQRLSHFLYRAWFASCLSGDLWAIACTLEAYANDAIYDDAPTSVYSFSEPVKGIEEPIDALITDVSSAKRIAAVDSHPLARNTLVVLAELEKSMLSAQDFIMKALEIEGPFGQSLLPAKKAMRKSFHALSEDYQSTLKDLAIEFNVVHMLRAVPPYDGEHVREIAGHTSYWWDKPLTENEMKYTEERYGPLVNTLLELAELVREADKNSKSGPDPTPTHSLSDLINDSDDGLLNLYLSQDTYKFVMRAHASARKLRAKIEAVVGPEQAARFYDGLREVLGFVETYDPKGFRWAGSEGKAEGIARSIEEWHHRLLFLAQADRTDITREMKRVKEPAKLTDTESNILEALGGDALHGPELLSEAGYGNSSHYRAILSNLVKREILGKNERGYYAKNRD